MESPAGSEVSEGPVLSLMNKRLRALRKKYNRILQMEESVVQGKPLNKEQEDVLRSKTAVVTLIEEYEKLRQPLSVAVQEEVSRFCHPSSKDEKPAKSEDEISSSASEPKDETTIENLLPLLYFGCLFDVKPQSEFTSMMVTRTHERGCCLTYDYVTDEATELLGERDLDMISTLGGLVTSRPVYSGVSHKSALSGCLQHAKLWLQNSDQPIHPGATVTYAGLREKLNKIMASDYFTTTPEMKAPVDVAAAVGMYNTACQIPVAESTIPGVQVDGDPANPQQKEDEHEDFQATEVGLDQSNSMDEPPKMEDSDELNPSGDNTTTQQEQEKLEADSEYNQRDTDQKEHQYNPRRTHLNQRGGNRGGAGGGGRRGYPNGRGGRSGRGGGYQNGRSQQYYENPGYYPRNYYNARGRGGGGRSGGPSMYNDSQGAGSTTHGGHVELGATS